MRERVHVVLMAGGAGTRFWPLSRRRRPKQVLPIVGDLPMVRTTRERVADLVPAERVLVVTGADQRDALREALPDVPGENFLFEPCSRNTAPCLGLAATVARAREPDALLLNLPADHVIEPVGEFVEAAGRALARADGARTLVTFGIEPTHAATGYGYIRQGEPTGRGVFRVARFVEKPDRPTAEGYLEEGGYLWNSGMFAWRADAFLEEVGRHLPDLAAGLERIAADPDLLADEFPGLPWISVDHGVLEKTDRAETIPVDFGWDDVGSFEALASRIGADAHGNRARGDLLAIEGSGLLSLAPPGHLVATIGVSDLVVVVTEDATLVCPRDRVQEVKRVVTELERRDRRDLT